MYKTLLKTLLPAVVAVTTFFTAFAYSAQDSRRLPEIGTTGAAFLSIEREQVVGDFYMRQVRAQAPIIYDPVLDNYLSNLGQRLVRHSSGVKYPFNFFWIRNNEINAFAFMGGYVGVHTGLIQEARTESELAAVLGHEVAHVTQRHIVRRMQEQQQNMPMTIAGVIGSILLGMANPEAGMAGLYTTLGATGQSQINYTRLYEKEADRIGLSVLLAAGFDPMGAPDFFGRLAEKYRYVSKPPEMLMTHPLPESRIADTRARAESMRRIDVKPSLEFALAKARVEARYAGNPSVSDFQDMANSSNPINQRAGTYGLAIIALDRGQYNTASEHINTLLKDEPNNPFYIDVQTDILLGQENYEYVMEWLESKYIRQPTEPVITINFANAALTSGNGKLAEKLLREFLLQNPNHPLALDLLTRVYEKSGKRAAMYETRAEALALRGNFSLAINQLHTAHNHTDNDITRKRINARIDQLRALENQARNIM